MLLLMSGDPNGIRTRVNAVKGRRPRPLNDGAMRQTKRHSYRGKSIRVSRPNAKPSHLTRLGGADMRANACNVGSSGR